jgi:tRNA(His) 5'-end guanylyltransferase
VTLIVSLFTSAYVFHWGNYFPDRGLDYPPVFDGRLVVYPSAVEVKDYFKWRGVDSRSHGAYFVWQAPAESLRLPAQHISTTCTTPLSGR